MYLQPSVAPPSPAGARIARPFIPDVIIALRAGARRGLGATAKPLYPIDGKAAGLDRRTPRPPSSREVFGVENRRFESYRRARDARPYNAAGNCNCEMHFQRWVASLQRSDVFATVGCTVVHRRGAHCAPVRPRRYNSNFSSGRAKGLRGDRKAPISNRRQGRKALTGEAPDLPHRGRGTAPRAVEGVRTPCVERRPPSSQKNLFQTSYASYASYARHISGI